MQDVVPEVGYAVKSGVVRVYTVTSEGDERSISFVVRNEVFPICWIFAKTEATLFYYVAHTDCEVYVVGRDSFHTNLQASSSLLYSMVEHTVSDYVTKTLQIKALEQPRASLKLLHTLDYFAVRFNKKIINDVVMITVPLTQTIIASFAGLTRETVTLEMRQLRSKKIVTIKNKFYSINTTKLHELIETERASVISLTL